MIILGIVLMVLGFIVSLIGVDYIRNFLFGIVLLLAGTTILIYTLILNTEEWAVKCESLGGVPKIGRDHFCFKPNSIIEVK